MLHHTKLTISPTPINQLVKVKEWGNAEVITRGPPIQPELLRTIKTKGRTFTSSYKEELAVMESTLTWTSTTANHPLFTILICTDSKDLCEALLSSNLSSYVFHS